MNIVRIGDEVVNKNSLDEIMAKCILSTKATAKILFPERFYLPFSKLHDKIFEVLDDDGIQKAVIKAPRGFGKTSTVNLAYPAKKILFRDKKFIVPISNTATQAVMQSENLKMELMGNTDINKIFGPVHSKSVDSPFSKDMWIADYGDGVCILPRGAGQQVRGILWKNYRPDLIIVDDLEDTEGVKSEEQRKKLKQWFFSDVLNSVNRGMQNWKVIVIGTLLHEDSLLANLLDDPTWHHVELSLCDDDYKTNWPDFMTDAQIKELIESYREQGLLDSFYQEYMGQSISTEDAIFRSSYFRYHEESDLMKNRSIENVVIVDPAKTVKMHSDDSAIICWGINLESHELHQRDLIGKKLHPEELIDTAIEMCALWNARVLAVEVTSLNEFITYPIKNEIIRRGLNLELVELNARAKKEDRIKQLVPFYRRGMITHNKATCGQLEAQLLSFPRSKRWDCMDAAAYIVEVLELGERYFFPKAEYAKEEDYRDLMRDDYRDMPILSEDIPIEQINWRRI